MNIPEILLNTLEELGADDFRKFRWFLTQLVLKDFKPIPKSRLEDSPREETVNQMVQIYNKRPAVTITLEILRRMNHNEAAIKLKETCKQERDVAGVGKHL